MGPVGSRICKTVLGERSETSIVKYSDLGELTDPERKLVSLIGCYYYDLLPRSEPECAKAGMCLAIGDGPSQIFTKLRTRLTEEMGKPTSGPLDPDSLTSVFLLGVTSHLLHYIRQTNDRTCQVLEFHHPREMLNRIGGMLEINNEPQGLDQIVKDCQQTLRYCVRTGHPRFFNQISQGLDIIGLAGQWLTAVANADTCSYEVSPVFTLMEDIILSKMREYIGWKSEHGDGILTPGGTMSNLYAVAVARQRAAPHFKTQGMTGMERLVMFTSDQSHFSIKRAGVLLGVGSDNVIIIDSDQRGKMIISDLVSKIEEALASGATPFFVSLTAGTTVLGAFDPIDAAADVCERFNLWLHVDAAWGGGLLLSRRHKALLNGIHRADSVTWNPHKLMCAPLQCSAILTKEKGVLEACNSLTDSCDLDDPESIWDDVTNTTEQKSLQAGRHNDVFKVWLMWRAKGHLEYERQIDRLMELCRYMQQEIDRRSGFEFVINKPEFLNICFWYVPREMRHLPPGRDRDEKLGHVAPKIKGHLMNRGGTMIGYQPLGDHPNFFRMIISNPATVEDDIDYLLNEIEELGEL